MCALPVLETPKFELTLPSTKKKYKFRPFLAKEEKILLMAMEGGEDTEIINAIKELIEACVTGINVEKLAIFDLEYVFLKLREKSVGDIITLNVQHKNGLNSKREACDNKEGVEIDLSTVEVTFDEKHTNKIQITDSVGVVMKYPSFEMAESMDAKEDKDVSVFDFIKKSIDYIYDTENVYQASEHSDAELDEFIGSMSHAQLEKLQGFFETMPKLSHVIKWKCSKCGVEETITVEGLANFFM